MGHSAFVAPVIGENDHYNVGYFSQTNFVRAVFEPIFKLRVFAALELVTNPIFSQYLFHLQTQRQICNKVTVPRMLQCSRVIRRPI